MKHWPGSILAIVAFGQAFVILSGSLDISVGSLVAVTAIITSIIARDYGVAAGFIVGIGAGALFGLINGVGVARLKIQPVIMTIAMLNVARGLTFILSDAKVISGLPEAFRVLGRGETLGITNRIWAAIIILIVGQVFLSHFKLGRMFYATGSDAESARLSGVNVNNIKILAYVISGIMAAITGIIISGRANSGQPTIGVYLELSAIAAVVIGGTSLRGGKGGLVRTFGGAIIITILSNGMNMAGASPYLQDIAIGLVIIFAVLLDNLRNLEEVSFKKLFEKYIWMKKSA